VGSGNIGTDLLFKVLREPSLRCVGVIGIDQRSEGLAIARQRGIPTTDRGLDGMFEFAEKPAIVFDATTAAAHARHAEVLADHGIRSIDLTPAALGPMVVPDVNLMSNLDVPDINMVSCAAQATVPIVAALSRAAGGLSYAETVSTVASKSVGPGTRQNIDEFTQKTREALQQIGAAARGKAIALLNPAEPPQAMANTIYAITERDIDEDGIRTEIGATAERVRRVVPGFTMRGPIVDSRLIMVFTEVEGAGDYLPRYAGNLDIMTAAAVAVAKTLASAALIIAWD
jgi:acetaldehyde dehydrogenase (acetylating)